MPRHALAALLLVMLEMSNLVAVFAIARNAPVPQVSPIVASSTPLNCMPMAVYTIGITHCPGG